MSRVLTASLDYVQRWRCDSECCSFQTLARESYAHLFSDGKFRLSVRKPFMGVVDCSTCSRFLFSFKWMLLEVSHRKIFPELILEL